MTAGLLHTVPSLVATFDALLEPGVRRVHVADPRLLETVRRDGVTGQVREMVAAHARHLATLGARAVLVTCSSIGEVAEETDGTVGVRVLRIDAAMAAQAAQIAGATTGRIAVLATLPSTLGPTGRLVRRAAQPTTEVVAELVEGAAEAHDRGDRDRVEELVAAAVTEAAKRAGVIVLAQASMAGAAQRARVTVPVLTSPAGGVRTLLDAL